MANLLKNNISYTPQIVPDWFTKALKGGKIIEKGYIRVIPNVTKEAYLRSLLADGNTISQKDDRDCSWNPSKRINLNGKVSTVHNFKINEEQCLQDLDSVWSELAFSGGANKTSFPDGLEGAIMSVIQNSLSADIDRIIVGGAANAVDGVNDGLLDKALADADVVKVTGTTITADNVVDEIVKVYNAIPDAVINMGYFEPEKAAVRIYVPIHVYRSLRQALGVEKGMYQVVLPNFTYEGGVIRYMDIEIAVMPYLPANTMLAYSVDNVVFLTDLLADTASIAAEQGKNLKDENTFYIKGQYRANADYIFSDEIVVYSA